MEQQQNKGESVVAPLRKITPLSKYLAMALFICMPFLGGWIGYTYSPEKVVEVERLVNIEKSVGAASTTDPEGQYQSLSYRKFTKVDPTIYAISREYFTNQPKIYKNVPDILYASEGQRLSDDIILLVISSNPGSHLPFATVLYNEKNKEIVKSVSYPWGSVAKWISNTSQILFVISPTNQWQVVVRDYLNNTEEVLYTEDDTSVQLLDVCEIGCVGLLHTTTDGKVIFARHQKSVETTATKFIETIEVPIPQKYLVNL